jgi:hypothetical protein
MRCLTIALYALTVLIYFSLAMAIYGCGGGGGDTEQQEGSNPTTLMCEHNGDLWLCNEDNSCIRDQSTEEVAEMEELERGLFRVKMQSGNITIIAECGSNVVFTNAEITYEDNDTETSTSSNTEN